MKFEPHPDAERAYAQMMPGHPGFKFYQAHAGDWNFIVSLDLLHGVWSATWQVRRPVPGKRYSAQNCDPIPEGQKFVRYDSQHAAEAACQRKYRQLREAT